jgi:putative membrane protein
MENNIIAVDYEKKYKKLIIALSIIIPVAVAALFGIKIKGYDFSILPPIYATINGITAVVLIASLMAIKRKQIKIHQRLNNLAVLLSLSFLVMYVAYHITSENTPYGGSMKPLYYSILISHILLSVIVIPLVLFTYVKGWSGKIEQHRKWSKITFPIWLYVAITGVVVYLMISPYYVH